MCFDKLDTDKSDFRQVGRVFVNWHVLGCFAHVKSDTIIDKLDVFRWESEWMQTRIAANAHHRAHSRPL